MAAALVDSVAVQASNWEGAILVVLTLSASSLSSPTLPPPIYLMVARHTFLHLALEDAVRKLHQFAPMTLFFNKARGEIVRNKEPNPGTSLDDNDDDNNANMTNAESDAGKKDKDQRNLGGAAASSAPPSIPTDTGTKPYPICWFEDEDSQTALRWHLFAGVLYDLKQQSSIPWKIRLHFTSYPNSQILPLERDGVSVLEQVRNCYKNSLKQALCTQFGNNKAAMNLTKENHGRLWDSVRTKNYSLYRQVVYQDSHLAKKQHEGEMTRIPVRLLIDSRPPIQRPSPVGARLTLGQYLAKEASDLFDADGSFKASDNDANRICWKVAGLIRPSLDAPLLELWQDLRHPDHFLHIAVTTM